MTFEVQEQTWVLTEHPTLYVKTQKFETQNKIDINQLKEIFNIWTNELQLLSLNNDVKKEASIGYDFMNEMLENLKNSDEKKIEEKAITFYEKVLFASEGGIFVDLEKILNEVSYLAKGHTLKKLNEKEVAKKLAISTSSYYKVAKNFRGFSLDEFIKAKERFINVKKIQINKFIFI